MKERITGMIRDREKDDPRWRGILSTMPFAWIGTIDSFAGRILSEMGPFAGVDPVFLVAKGPQLKSLAQRTVLRTLWENEELLEPLLDFLTLDGVIDALSQGLSQNRANLLACRSATFAEAELPLHQDEALSKNLIEANLAFLRLFEKISEAYEQEMRAKRVKDFTGVLLALRQILSSDNHAEIKRRLQNQFKHIIVDEFQDTDFLQKEIIDYLRGPKTEVVYVGDAKQSIYRFRGAEVEVFSKARNEVRNSSGEENILHLDTNYRSHPGILEFCNRLYPSVFQGDDRPYAQGYEPVNPLPVEGLAEGSKGTSEDAEGAIERASEGANNTRVKLLFDPEDEAEAAACFIESIVGQEFDFLERETYKGEVKLVAKRRTIKFGDITLLLRKMRGGQGDRYMEAFRRHNIPYYTLGESGFFEIPEISGLVSLLKLIVNPHDDLAMATALISPVVGFDLRDLALLRYRAKSSERDATSLYDAFAILEKSDLSPAKKNRMTLFRRVLERFRDMGSILKPSEILQRAILDLDYGAYLALADPTERKLANLKKLVDASKSLDEADLSLREMVSKLELFGGDDVEQASIESEETDAVKIMTVHKAKGLEFPIVVLGGTSWTEPRNSDPFLFHGSGDDLVFSLLSKNPKPEPETFLDRLAEEEIDRVREEEKRTLYVATTRATDLLVLTFSDVARRGARPWRAIFENIVQSGEAGPELAPEFAGVVKVLKSSDLAPKHQSKVPTETLTLDFSHMGPVKMEFFGERQSPTWLAEPWEHQRADEALELETGQGPESEMALAPKVQGRLAHQILEALGVGGTTLESLGSQDNPSRPSHLYSGRFSDEELKEVWQHLERLKGHPLTREIETASNQRTEYEIIRPFGPYILNGRPDKLIQTKEGWKVVDFKFSDSGAHCKAYEFQMRFYLYLARDLFMPMLGAYLFYLKDGEVREVRLEDDEIQKFEEELRRRIENGEERIGSGEK